MVIDKKLLDKVTAQAKASPRLRMNYNFHQSLDEKCHRFLVVSGDRFLTQVGGTSRLVPRGQVIDIR